MIDFCKVNKTELEELEKKRKEENHEQYFVEMESKNPIINELRFNYGFYQIGPFLMHQETKDKFELAFIEPEKLLLLHFIGVTEKRKGRGTIWMKTLCHLADRYGYNMLLQVDEKQGTPKKVLESFYQTFGFTYTEEELSEMVRVYKK